MLTGANLMRELVEEGHKKTLDLGSCAQHVTPGAFQIAFSKTMAAG